MHSGEVHQNLNFLIKYKFLYISSYMNNQNYLIYFKRKNSLSLSNTESFRDLFPSMRLNLAHTIEEVLNQNRSNTLTI